MRNLKKRYLAKCIESKNPIITKLINEYKAYANGRILPIKTPLCGILSNLSELALPPSSSPIQSDTIRQEQLQYDHVLIGNQIIETDFYSSFNLGH